VRILGGCEEDVEVGFPRSALLHPVKQVDLVYREDTTEDMDVDGANQENGTGV